MSPVVLEYGKHESRHAASERAQAAREAQHFVLYSMPVAVILTAIAMYQQIDEPNETKIILAGLGEVLYSVALLGSAIRIKHVRVLYWKADEKDKKANLS